MSPEMRLLAKKINHERDFSEGGRWVCLALVPSLGARRASPGLALQGELVTAPD